MCFPAASEGHACNKAHVKDGSCKSWMLMCVAPHTSSHPALVPLLRNAAGNLFWCELDAYECWNVLLCNRASLVLFEVNATCFSD